MTATSTTPQRGRSRIVSLFAVLFMSLAGVISVASPASADTNICTGYSACTAAGRSNHGYQNNSATSYWTMYSGHNCTNYAAYMAIQNGASTPSVNLGSADAWATNALLAGIPVDTNIPIVGSIAQWNSNHVAYVEGVTKSNGTVTSITVSEENYLGDFHWRTITPSGDWPDNFIYFGVTISAMSSDVTGTTHHVYTGTVTGYARETWWTPGSSSPDTTPLENTGGSSVTAMSSNVDSGGIKHVYWGTSTGKVYETWWGAGNPVSTGELYDSGGSKITAMSSQITSDGVKHVYFGTAAGKVREARWGAGTPLTNRPLEQTGGSSVTSMTSALTGATQHVYWGTTSGYVYETSWSTGTPTTGPVTSVTGTSITAMSSQVIGVMQHVYFGTASGKVYEASWGDGNPVSKVFIEQTGGSSVTAVTSQVTSNIQHVYWGTSTGKVYESWWGGGNPVSTSELPNDNNSGITAMSSAITGTNTNHVYFGTSNGAVYETWWIPGSTSPATGQIAP